VLIYLFLLYIYLFIYYCLVGTDVMLWVIMLCYLVGFVEFVGYWLGECVAYYVTLLIWCATSFYSVICFGCGVVLCCMFLYYII